MEEYKILIVPNNLKNKIIKEKENSENIKVLTFLDVKNYLYEEYSKDALYFLVTTCHLEIPVARMYINNMKYLKDEDYSDKKLEKLKIYYNILKEYKKITFNKYGSLFFKNKEIEIFGFGTFSKLELSYIDKLKSLGNVTIKKEEVNLDKEIIVNEFFDIKDEVEYAAYLIAKEIESKTPVNKIYLSGIDDSSLPLVKRIFKYYNIPLPELESVNLYSTFIGKEFIALLKEKDKEEIVDILKDRFKNTANYLKENNIILDKLIFAGGVSANQYIKNNMIEFCKKYNYEIITPPLKLCTDNGAMIAWAGLEKFRLNKYDKSDILNIKSRWEL